MTGQGAAAAPHRHGERQRPSRRAPRLHRGSPARASVPAQRLPLLPAGGRAAQRLMSAARGAGPGAATAGGRRAAPPTRCGARARPPIGGAAAGGGPTAGGARGCGAASGPSRGLRAGRGVGARYPRPGWGGRAGETGLRPPACESPESPGVPPPEPT